MTEPELYEFMHEHFSYDPQDGVIRIKNRYHPRQRPVGYPAGYNRRGRRGIRINNVYYVATHLIWLMMYGRLPDEEHNVDHIDGNTLNDRLCNLRVVNRTQNGLNRLAQKNSTTGTVGVYIERRKRKHGVLVTYRARIVIEGVLYSSKRVSDLNEAILLRRELELTHANGYTRATSKQRELT